MGRIPSFLSVVVLALLSAGGAAAQIAAPDSLGPRELGHPGYLIMEAARDSSAGYRWEKGPASGQISLRWEGGLLTIPDTLALEAFARSDLAIPVLQGLTGVGQSGSLRWQDGRYRVSEPLILADGRITSLVSSGDLEILGSRVRYRLAEYSDQEEKGDPRAPFLMLAGIVLLIWVLLRRARKRIKQSL